jgi:hypothetical protein
MRILHVRGIELVRVLAHMRLHWWTSGSVLRCRSLWHALSTLEMGRNLVRHGSASHDMLRAC